MRFLSRLFVFLVIFLLLIGIFIAALPTLISTEWGTKQIVAMVNRKIPGKIEIQNLQIRWGHGQTITGASLKDPEGKPIADFEKFHTDASLWQLIQKSTGLGQTLLQNLNLSVITDSSGQTNLQKALGIQKTDTALPPSVISLSNVNANLSVENGKGPLSAHMTGQTRQDNLEGSFNIDILLNQILASNWDEISKEAEKLLTVEGSKDAVINVKVVNFPVDLIDRLTDLKDPKFDSFFHRLLGDRLNLNVDKEKDQDGLVVNLKATSPKMNGSLKGTIVKGMISLKEPSRFTFLLDPESINPLFQDEVLQATTNATFVLNDLTIPLRFFEKEVVNDPCQIGFKANLDISPTVVKELKISALSVQASAPTCDKVIHVAVTGKAEKNHQPYNIDLSLQANKPTSLKDLETLLDKIERGKLTATTPKIQIGLNDLKWQKENEEGKLSGILTVLKPDSSPDPLAPEPIPFNISAMDQFSNFIVDLHGSSLHGHMEGSLEADNHLFNLTQPANITYFLTPAGFKEISQMADKELPSLQNTAKIDIRIDPAKIDLNDPLEELEVKGAVNIDKLVLKDLSNRSVTFENLILPWAINNVLESILVKLNGEAYTNPNEKHTRLALRISSQRLFYKGKLDLSQTQFEIISEFFSLPTSLISSFVASKNLTPILGPLMDVDLRTSIDMTSQAPGYWDMFVDSANLSVKARIKLGDSITLYQSNKPTASLKWTITPESYAYMKPMMTDKESDVPMTLSEPVTLTAYLTDLDIPLTNTPSWANNGKIVGEFESTDIHWKEIPKLKPFTFKGSIKSTNIANQVDFTLNALSENSSLAFNGTVLHLFNQAGQQQKVDQIGLKGELDAKKLPLSWFQTFYIDEGRQKQIRAILGDPIDATTSFQLDHLNGPVKAKISGSNGFVSLDGNVNKGILTLASPFQWQIKVTPQLGQDLLQTDMPLLSSIVNAEKPLLLSLDPASFSCPLYPFDFNKITIGRGKIDLGKVTVRNEGDIQAVLSLIKTIPQNQFVLWFTPIYFKMDKGTFTLNRFDLLVANMYTLAGWGTIDLNADKMDLILGLSAQSLRYAFNIQGLSDDYLLQVPIKGRKGKVDVDKTKVTAKISALIAQSHGDSNVKLIGSLVDMALSDGGAPKPTTQPFPWASEFVDQSTKEQPKQQDNAPSSDSKSKKAKKDKSSLLEQGANTLLNQLLKS